MAIDTWGDKPKSQIDASTVDEEIDAKIDDHLADPDAHLEVGQSLQSHKASEIIDHLAKSIVEDKIDDLAISSRCITTDQIVGKDIRTATDVGSTVDGVKMVPTGIEMWQGGDKKVDIPISGDPIFKGNVKVNSLEYLKYTLNTYFESLDGFVKSSVNVYSSFGALSITPGTEANSWERLYSEGELQASLFCDYSKNPIFDTTVLLYFTGQFRAFIGSASSETGFGVCFKFTENYVYACWKDENDVIHTDQIHATPNEEYHRYRIEVESGVEVRWYIDGVLVVTKTWAQIGSISSINTIIGFYIKNLTVDEYAHLHSINALFQQDF